MPSEIPIVSYLELRSDGPCLVVTRCIACDARYFGSRVACSHCGARDFDQVDAAKSGTVRSFSIVHRAAPGVPAPFVSATIALDDGTAVKANVVGCAPDPEHIKLGMRVNLEAFEAGTDDDGLVAVAFGFSPAEEGIPT